MTACIYTTRAAAQAALNSLEDRARGFWLQTGYVVDEVGVVPKCVGVDAPYAQRTVKWDDLREYVEGWGFASPRTLFPEYADALLVGHEFEEIEATVNVEPGV